MGRSRVRQLGCLLWLATAIGAVPEVNAQLGAVSSTEQAPQAKTQAELDDYLEIVTDATPADKLRDAQQFTSRYPRSELAGVVYQEEMHAYEQTGNFEELLIAGEKALQANPDNVSTLLTLAPAIANYLVIHPERNDLVDLAVKYARLSLEGISKTKPPREISYREWEAKKKQLESQAHEVLGITSLSRRNLDEAISEFRLSIELTAAPQGAQYVRLGVALASAGRIVESVQSYRHAADLGPESVRKVALEQISKLSDSKSRP